MATMGVDPKTTVLDVNYVSPDKTLELAAKKVGAHYIDGKTMFNSQAKLQSAFGLRSRSFSWSKEHMVINS